MSVADYLIKNANLDAERVGVAGYGQYRPAFAGSSRPAANDDDITCVWYIH